MRSNRQVAQLLGWDMLKVRQAARTGVLPAYRLPKGRRYRFFRDEIVEWVEAQSAAGSSDS